MIKKGNRNNNIIWRNVRDHGYDSDLTADQKTRSPSSLSSKESRKEIKHKTSILRKTQKNKESSHTILEKLQLNPFKSPRLILTAENRAIQLRETMLLNQDRMLHKRTLILIQRFLTYGINEVKRMTMALFKTKMYDIIYTTISYPNNQNDIIHINKIVSFSTMPSLIVENDYLFPNYYDMREVFNLCEDIDNLIIFIKSSLSNIDNNDLSSIIIKKYIKDKRYNYEDGTFCNMVDAKRIALIFKDGYDNAITLIKQSYHLNSESKFTPSLYYLYEKYNSLYTNQIIIKQDNIDVIIETSLKKHFPTYRRSMRALIKRMKINTWIDYQVDILEQYQNIIEETIKSNDIVNDYLLINVLFITHYINEKRKCERIIYNTEFETSLIDSVAYLHYYFFKYKYMFFGEDFNIQYGFHRTSRVKANYCVNLHGSDIIVSYLVYKYCYDETMIDVEKYKRQHPDL